MPKLVLTRKRLHTMLEGKLMFTEAEAWKLAREMAKEVPELRGKERIVVAEIRRSFAELVISTNPEEAFMAAVRRIAERVVLEK
jgi:hypothetical protein